MSHTVAVIGAPGAMPARASAPHAHAAPATRVRRSSKVLRLLLFVMVAIYLGRLHDLFSFTATIPVGKVLLPIGWLALLAQPRLGRRFGALKVTQAKMFFLLAFAMALSVPFSMYKGGSLEAFMGFLKGTLPFVLLIALGAADEHDLGDMVRAFVVTGALLGLALMAGLGATSHGRMSLGATYDANDVALVGVLVFPLAVWLMRGRSVKWKWVGVAGGAGALAIVMTAASRGGMLGLGAVLLMIGVRYRKHLPLQWKLGAVVMLVTAFSLAPPTFWERFKTLKDPNADYNAFDQLGRKAIWMRGIGYFVRDPITGVGLDQFGTAEGAWAVSNRGSSAGFKWSAAHSVWIQVLAELGIFGIIAFVGLYVPTMRDAKRLRRLAKTRAPPPEELVSLGDALSIAVIGFMVSGTFLAMAYSPPAMILAAIGISFSRIASQATAHRVPAPTPAVRRAGRR